MPSIHPSIHACVRPCSRPTTCARAGVRAHPRVCVCLLVGSAGADKKATALEETDIDADETNQLPVAEELNVNRGVTDLDATAKTSDLSRSRYTVRKERRCRRATRHVQGLLSVAKSVANRLNSCLIGAMTTWTLRVLADFRRRLLADVQPQAAAPRIKRALTRRPLVRSPSDPTPPTATSAATAANASGRGTGLLQFMLLLMQLSVPSRAVNQTKPIRGFFCCCPGSNCVACLSKSLLCHHLRVRVNMDLCATHSIPKTDFSVF